MVSLSSSSSARSRAICSSRANRGKCSIPYQAVAHGVVHGHHQVFCHGQVAEQTDILKGPGDAGPIHLGCGHAVGVLAVQHNGARCGLVYLFSKNAFSFAAAEAAAASPRRGGRQEENGKRVYFSL